MRRIPKIIEDRLYDAGYLSLATIPVERVAEECHFVITLIESGSPEFEENAGNVLLECREYLGLK